MEQTKKYRISGASLPDHEPREPRPAGNSDPLNLLTREDLTSGLLKVARRAPPPKQWLTVQAAADYLGVAASTVYKWKSEKKLRASTVGSVVRFGIKDLVDFMVRHAK